MCARVHTLRIPQMAEHEKEDRTARAIRERRERAGMTQKLATVPTAAPVILPVPILGQQIPAPGQTPTRSRLSEDKKAEIRREIDSLKDRPVIRARKLAYYHSSGISQEEIAVALGVGQPWVSKRIALTQASPEVLQQIEMGALTETGYYNKRGEMEARLTGTTRSSRRRRPATMPITIDAARAVIEILEHVARKHNAPPVNTDSLDDSRLLSVIIDMRAGELRDAMVKK